MNPISLEKIYEVRKNFIIIGLTGRTGAGCSNVTEILEKNFSENDFPKPLPKGEQIHAEDVKYDITYHFLKENYKPYTAIRYREIISFFIFRSGYEKLFDFLSQNIQFSEFLKTIEKHKIKIQELENDISKIKIDNKEKENLMLLNYFYFDSEFQNFSEFFLNDLSNQSMILRNKFLQMVANNLRRIGTPYDMSTETDPGNVYFIAKFINILIKSCRLKSKVLNNQCQIVIDSLRNSLEMNFFKQRYSAFYMISVSRHDCDREMKIHKHFGTYSDEIIKMDNEEHKGIPGKFYTQDVSNCIQKSDIHLYNVRDLKAQSESFIYNTRIISLKHQLVKYLSLILQPGIITPTPQERCMQMAYTAKYNSGCISRQVGAVITDENYSIKSIGWNNTPEGHLPCLLRNVNDLVINTEGKDLCWYSNYEKEGLISNNNQPFFNTLLLHYKDKLSDTNIQSNLSGRNVSFCFKTIINSYQEGKNQVHTRSLHAEENAFLQITKYGGQGIQGGFLFTTASPCELCAKKAFQLGIKTIYYIDPYPGITETHILECGQNQNRPKMIHFSGAIGNAYHWLYEPFMSYKDELSLLIGLDIKNENDTLKEKVLICENKLKDLGYHYDNEKNDFIKNN